MKAEIVTIGDEILIGQIVDTNSAWISRCLNDAGITVDNRVSVGDDTQAISTVLSEAMEHVELIIVTGGLGPTKDDITKKTLADLFGCGMHVDQTTYEAVERMLLSRGVEFNELNKSQALVPDKCTVLPNPNGTAPGMWFEYDGGVLISLPGVPFEMKALMQQEVMPRLRKRFTLGAVVHRTLVTLGLPESELAATIAGWEDSLPEYLSLAYLPGTSGIKLRLSAYDVDEQKAAAQMENLFSELHDIIPDYILGHGDATVQSVVAEMLSSSGKTLALAESCTGGKISELFTAMSGASDYFRCGVTAYQNDIKVDLLGVSPESIEKYGVVSTQVAEQMAEGVRKLAGADYAIATTGIAGRAGATGSGPLSPSEPPVGTVCIAVASLEGVVSVRRMFGSLRQQNIERASSAAINMLRLILLDKAGKIQGR